ncbi:hypothetical protein BAE52_10695 [Pseudomonas sp. EGD-AKN5]|nr:hypothetical protein BAE52_10695 [Pseudomonas sp. EGD-AKN5]
MRRSFCLLLNSFRFLGNLPANPFLLPLIVVENYFGRELICSALDQHFAPQSTNPRPVGRVRHHRLLKGDWIVDLIKAKAT